jgi:hypothetical protein
LAIFKPKFLVAKFYIEQDPDPDPHQNGLDPQHCKQHNETLTHHKINLNKLLFFLILIHGCCDNSNKSARTEQRQAIGSA